MKVSFKYFIIITTLLLFSCSKIELYGDTFYTVEGTIVNENDLPLANFNLQVLTAKDESILVVFGASESRIVVADSKTNSQGRFKITFPNSNGSFVLQISNGYIVALPTGANTYIYNNNLIALEKSKMVDYRRDLKIIKVK